MTETPVTSALITLLPLVECVCEFDWPNYDPHAVDAMARLRMALYDLKKVSDEQSALTNGDCK